MNASEAVSAIPVRRPELAITRELPRHWYAGDPAATHVMDALSSVFPDGEAFFVRSVLRFRERIADPALREAVQGFAGQEAQHSQQHGRHLELLLEQGYSALAWRNRLMDRVLRWLGPRAPRLCLAATAALEHLTAILARRLLSDPERWTAPMDPRMQRLWRWHALEEAEHKAVAFDVLARVAPSRALRGLALALNTPTLCIEILDRALYMLWKDGLLARGETWRGLWRFLFASGGLLRGLGPEYRAWYRQGFHPQEIDDLALIEAARRDLAG